MVCLSVAIMRILIGIYSVIHQSLHPEVTSYPVDTKKDFFANSSLVSLIIVLFTTESYLKFEKTKSYLKGKKKL
ncbi:hypothetical protein HK099_007125 [Clydaea vesicula]|uniref:Uncharacterized protein n=1 Tax=Clydaea vesicula TaxID=447962 RepID=A0AAD5TXA1_9FUNG|nr:hypothetical protein HK099_007125 [Clydaea vesicula]